MKNGYYIKLSDGQVVPVTEEVYREYKRPQWREAKQKKVRQMREFSFSKKTQEVNSMNIQNAASATDAEVELIGLLTAISVVSKRLANNLRKLQEQKNGGAEDARSY